ncbi:LPXTG cell wall anchor domain-containing protein [Enterococcus sp. AZ173]|uniref:LPXTG cell wall anchor domain-containing protein n=1 Tax=Enterococcus sp. AZ173 TaxID=2774700 RepID=UPI003D2E5323
MDGAADIQVFGQLGMKTKDSNTGSDNGSNQTTTETAERSVVPEYTVNKEYPKTGEANQSIYGSFLGIVILMLLFLIVKKRKRQEKHNN